MHPVKTGPGTHGRSSAYGRPSVIILRMNTDDARYLAALNERFYRLHADSFSDTRQAPWQGWIRACDRVVPAVREAIGRAGHGEAFDEVGITGRDEAFEGVERIGDGSSPTVRVLDAACGNLRFERFLAARYPHVPFAFDAVDSCVELARLGSDGFPGGDVRFEERDLIGMLLEDPISPFSCEDAYDLAVCFGFMHHAPGFENRLRLLEAMMRATRPEGFTVATFWQFTNDPARAAKSRRDHARLARYLERPIAFEPGDFLLGWQDDEAAVRYCHEADDEEIDRLVAALGRRMPDTLVVDRFKSDGRTDDLNAYVVLQRA